MREIDANTRAETVGSLLRSPELAQALVSGALADSGYSDRADQAVLDCIRLQEDAGLDVITDGEVRRRSWAETPDVLDCFEVHDTELPLEWHGADGEPVTQSATGRVVVRRIASTPESYDRVAAYRFLADHTSKRTKFTLPAPSYHRRFWSDRYSAVAYARVEDYLNEIRDYTRGVVDRLVALGCDYVQLDAPNYGSLCDPAIRARLAEQGHDLDRELAFDAELDNSVFDGLSNVTSALHICRGNNSGGRWHSTGGYGAISAELFPALRFDRLLLEYDSERAGAFGPLAAIRTGTAAVLGLLTTKSGDLEDSGLVEARIAEASTVKPLEELAISTQCGFASTAAGNPVTPQQQQAKLTLVAQLARKVWPAA